MSFSSGMMVSSRFCIRFVPGHLFLRELVVVILESCWVLMFGIPVMVVVSSLCMSLTMAFKYSVENAP